MTQEVLSRIPLGFSEFADLRSDGKIYVDKTDLIYQIATTGKMYFLSRPRRFGKSLLISTLASLFAHGTRDFKGLAIEKLWTDKTYPVLRLDFSEVKEFSSQEDLDAQLVELLDDAAEEAGLSMGNIQSSSFVSRFSKLLASQDIRSLVLLIDEYDAPLTNNLNSPALFEEARKLFAKFYSKVKARNGVFRHVFMTGITCFNQTSIFSAFNNLEDISLDSKFGALLGYTDEEIDTYFSEAVELAAENLSLPRTVVRQRMKDWYDGYCFESAVKKHVYAPWSVLSFLKKSDEGFKNYWYLSGGQSTLLKRYLDAHPEFSFNPFRSSLETTLETLTTTTDHLHLDPIALLVQAGYLTIESVSYNRITVNCPNEELRQSMSYLELDRAAFH